MEDVLLFSVCKSWVLSQRAGSPTISQPEVCQGLPWSTNSPIPIPCHLPDMTSAWLSAGDPTWRLLSVTPAMQFWVCSPGELLGKRSSRWMFHMETSAARADARACLGIFKRFHKLVFTYSILLGSTRFWLQLHLGFWNSSRQESCWAGFAFSATVYHGQGDFSSCQHYPLSPLAGWFYLDCVSHCSFCLRNTHACRLHVPFNSRKASNVIYSCIDMDLISN